MTQGVIFDITDRKRAEQELRYLANYDTLFTRLDFPTYFMNSVIVVLAATFASLVFSYVYLGLGARAGWPPRKPPRPAGLCAGGSRPASWPTSRPCWLESGRPTRSGQALGGTVHRADRSHRGALHRLAMIVELQRDPDDFCASAGGERRHDRAVDAAGHGDDDPRFRARAARGKFNRHGGGLYLKFTLSG